MKSMEKSYGKKDMKSYEKVYKLINARIRLVLDFVESRKTLEADLKSKQKYEYINMENPKTFDDKLWYMKRHFFSPLAVKCADKVLAREYVKDCGFGEILVPVHGIYESIDDVDFGLVPDECYIKCNGTSGCNYLYKKNQTDEKWIKKLFQLYQRRNYYKVSKEWVYKDARHQIIIEEKLEEEEGESLKDYRMFCFHGSLKVVMVNIGTATKQGEHAKEVLRSFYTPEFEWIQELRILGDRAASKRVDKPKNWDKMVEIAEKLSQPFAFCRVDLYNVTGKIYFSEMTFFPNGGINNIKPDEWGGGIWNMVRFGKV